MGSVCVCVFTDGPVFHLRPPRASGSLWDTACSILASRVQPLTDPTQCRVSGPRLGVTSVSQAPQSVAVGNTAGRLRIIRKGQILSWMRPYGSTGSPFGPSGFGRPHLSGRLGASRLSYPHRSCTLGTACAFYADLLPLRRRIVVARPGFGSQTHVTSA